MSKNNSRTRRTERRDAAADRISENIDAYQAFLDNGGSPVTMIVGNTKVTLTKEQAEDKHAKALRTLSNTEAKLPADFNVATVIDDDEETD